MPQHSSPALPPTTTLLPGAPRRSWVARARRPASTHDDGFPDTLPLMAVDYLGYEPPPPESFSDLPTLEELLARKRALARPDRRLLPDIDLTLNAPALSGGAGSNAGWGIPQFVSDYRQRQAARQPIEVQTLDANTAGDALDSDLPSIFIDDVVQPRHPVEATNRSPRPLTQLIGIGIAGLMAATLVSVVGWRLASGLSPHLPCLGDASECVARVAADSPRVSATAASSPAIERPNTPHLPCKFVGYWTYEAEGTTRRVVLQDDGSYLLNPDAVLTGREFTGHWTVQGTNFVWRHDQVKSDVPDINPIAEEGPEHFVLVEMNGDRTRFDRIASLPTTRCVR